MESHLHSILAYFSAHPTLALACVFAGAVLEAVAIIGTVIPGSSFVFLGGVLAGLGVLDLATTTFAAVIGAILGDGVSYWIGHRYGHRLATSRLLRKHPHVLARGRAYFARNGGKSVFLGRFLGPVRAVVPVLAGMAGMSMARFYTLNALSALAWAAAHLLPGWLFGASLQLAGAVSSRLATLLIVLAVAIWAIARLLVYAYDWASPRLNLLRRRLVRHARAYPGFGSHVLRSLLDPDLPESHALLLLAGLLVGGGWLFLGVLEDVVTKDPLVRFDESVHAALQALRTSWADNAMVFVTEVGGAAGLVPVLVAVSVLLVIKRYWRTLGYWLAAAAFAEALVWTLKDTLGRARPSVYSGLQQFSFPSGHVALAIVVYGFLAFLVGRHRSVAVQAAVTIVAAVAIAFVAFSRLYLGVHWFSDVLASVGLGLVWVALLAIAYTQHVRNERLGIVPALSVTLTTLAVVSMTYVRAHLERDVAQYTPTQALPTVTLDAWLEGGWRQLPHARLQATGTPVEPLNVQWAADPAAIEATLTSQGWHAAPSWFSAAALQSIVPGAAVDDMPVVPKFNQGEPPDLVWTRPIDAEHRLVLRLWDVYQVADTRDADARVWIGMASEERVRHVLHLFNYVTTSPDFTAPRERLATELAAQQYRVLAQQSEGRPLILVAPRSQPARANP